MHADSWPGNSKEKNQEYSLEQKKKKNTPPFASNNSAYLFLPHEKIDLHLG